jgi:CBS domain containing-hemolysin-like protein
MSEPARSTAQDAQEGGRGLFTKLKRWLASETDEAEAVRDVIEELIEERIEDRGEGEPAIDPNERLLLANVLKLRTVTAVDIMVPRADIVAIDASTAVTDALALVVKEGHSRLPVYRETLDDEAGLIHIKDLLRPVLFVSPAVRGLDLLLEMRLKRAHMAMVVDEYGGIDGLVTIEDVVEQIVGEIEDEHDADEAPQMIERPDGAVLADGRLPLKLLEERIGKIFSDEEREAADTLGGLVARLAGRMPSRGELVRHSSGVEFEVTDSDPRLVRRLRILNIPPPKPEQ